MKLEDEFRDLQPLALREEPDRGARMIAGIEAAAAPELARRAALPNSGLLMLLSSWTRPALSAAAAIASAAAVMLLLWRAPTEEPAAVEITEELGYPGTVTAWFEGGWTPSVEELLITMSDEAP